MLSKRKRLIVIISLFVLCIFGCIGLAEIAQKGSEGHPPIRGMTITIDENRREELFAQLRKFADKHGFEFHLDFYDPDEKIFLVAMYRDDLKILAADVPKAPTKIRLDFYDRDPATPTPKETVEDLFSDLKRFISEIPDVTITEDR